MPKLYLYNFTNPPFGHEAVSLEGANSQVDFYSFHAITQVYILALKNDPDFRIPGEPRFAEADISRKLLELWNRQLKPMISCESHMITDPNSLPPPSSPPIEIEITPEEYTQLKNFFEEKKQGTKLKKLRYSLFPFPKHQHCASLVDEALNLLPEKPPLKPGIFANVIKPPYAIHQNAQAIQQMRQGKTPSPTPSDTTATEPWHHPNRYNPFM